MSFCFSPFLLPSQSSSKPVTAKELPREGHGRPRTGEPPRPQPVARQKRGESILTETKHRAGDNRTRNRGVCDTGKPERAPPAPLGQEEEEEEKEVTPLSAWGLPQAACMVPCQLCGLSSSCSVSRKCLPCRSGPK